MIITKETDLQGADLQEGATLLVNKELGWTSFDLVAKIRSILSKHYKTKKLKVGHGGTLDPLATGLMVIGVGPHTKQLQNYQNQGKEYVAKVKFGATTPSFDCETEEDRNYPTDSITESSIKKILSEKFTGDLEQVPPIFSAKSVNGKRAYESARKGEELELAPVQISISDIELISFENNIAEIRVACTKGTYIRSLARDIGWALGSGAYLTGLVRTKSGSYCIEDAIGIDHIKQHFPLEKSQ
jgi:tRNA pseudouridine55 synthase